MLATRVNPRDITGQNQYNVSSGNNIVNVIPTTQPCTMVSREVHITTPCIWDAHAFDHICKGNKVSNSSNRVQSAVPLPPGLRIDKPVLAGGEVHCLFETCSKYELTYLGNVCLES